MKTIRLGEAPLGRRKASVSFLNSNNAIFSIKGMATDAALGAGFGALDYGLAKRRARKTGVPMKQTLGATMRRDAAGGVALGMVVRGASKIHPDLGGIIADGL